MRDLERFLDKLNKTIELCSCAPKTLVVLEEIRKKVSSSANLSPIFEDLQIHVKQINNFSETVGQLVQGGANLNNYAALFAGTSGGNEQSILDNANALNESLTRVRNLLDITESVGSIAADRNTLNVLSEVFEIGGTVTKNAPLSQLFKYYNEATKGIYKGLQNFALDDSIKNLRLIDVLCFAGSEADKGDLKRLKLSVGIKF